MRKTSVYLFLILFYWLILMQAVLHAQNWPGSQLPQAEHSQSMHQYIVREACRLLEAREPGAFMRLKEHIGTADPGSQPWQQESILSGAYREDEEDIVYGYGDLYQPSFGMERSGSCSGLVYDYLESLFLDHAAVLEGFTSVSHFWDENASDNVLRKRDVYINVSIPFNCLNTNDQRFNITPAGNAWDKIQLLLRPNGQVAIRDRWWVEGDVLLNALGAQALVLPSRSQAIEILWRYSTLADLYNSGMCSVEIPGKTGVIPVVLGPSQRKRYVWDILGRACHLLGDMSVPAHTHKDMHMTNQNLQGSRELGVDEFVYTIIIKDEDSYESWIGNPMNAYWTADMIQDGLVPLQNVSDPLYHLMSSMRSIAAQFASDDHDGNGPVSLLPHTQLDFPYRYNDPPTNQQYMLQLLTGIRDNTLPYAIRATATLLHWFVTQLDMPLNYDVNVVGAHGYDSYYQRSAFNHAFPGSPTSSGTYYPNAVVGDVMSLRAHIHPHASTRAKHFFWTDNTERKTAMHQWDTYTCEKLEKVYDWYYESHVQQVPELSMRDEFYNLVVNGFPSFRDPWHVNPALSTAWTLEQPNDFREYKPLPAHDANGGVFISIYDVNKPPLDYYSIRASKLLDKDTRQHKNTGMELGDYSFLEWEAVYATLMDDPKEHAWPPLPAYVNSQEYDTKLVDFLQNTASVKAVYKNHRSSDATRPPSSVNSQRKVAKDQREIFHAVYESSGRIWYVSSSNRGVSWAPEQRVSDNSAVAVRPAVASLGDVVWAAYVADGEVVVSAGAGTNWVKAYSAPVTMKDDCTPAIAVLGDYEGAAARGPVICVVWEDLHELRFALLQGRNVLVDNQLLAAGRAQAGGGVDQPRFPSVAASTMTPAPRASDHGFHIAWIEAGNIYYVNIGVDRRNNPLVLSNWRPGGAIHIETAHARTGSVGAAYPARHAPSVAVTREGTVHLAFDVTNWYSTWPVNSAGNIGVPTNPLANPVSSLFAVRERPLPTTPNGPTWQTTTTLVGGSSVSTLCSPSIGAFAAPPAAGSKSGALRVVYNDSQGQLRVARFDGGLNVSFHAEGWDPSITAWAPHSSGMLDVYSYTAPQPHAWHLLASQQGLAKAGDADMQRMRQILLTRDGALASCGIASPRLRGGDTERPIEWNVAHDSTVLGVNSTLAEKMRTAVFTPAAGERLLVDIERFAMETGDTQAEVLLRVNDAHSGEALRVISLPLHAFASAAAMAVQEIDLSGVAGAAVYVDATVFTPGEKWDTAVVDRYAPAVSLTDTELSKDIEIAAAYRPALRQNHPNPFNPSTSISYRLPEAGAVRLAVYNLLGQEVAVLHDGWRAAGEHTVSFDGVSLPGGVYLYRLECAGSVHTRSMHLVK